ncbi:hypothetical protein OOK27_05550 [Streptomyces canus]|uniref:hypothetical protein n=1 Tax=Streptomyces canus TaxID=58343 RepID=UPI0022527846|nr:hypothetical protein [Streptomyces canus]MCX5253639.1 hypothetical protein [Streptomyces canus]
MPEEHKIVDILAGEIGPGVHGWSIITERPGGILWQHSFPADVLEWRAAEYGLTDPAEIVDGILHEPYQDTGDIVLPPSVRVKAAAVKAAKKADPHGPTLQEATSTTAARAAQRSKVAAIKTERVRITDPDGLLLFVHQNHGMDPDRVRTKRELVDVHRWSRLYGGLPVPAPVPTDLEAPRA